MTALGKARRAMYRGARSAGDLEALASGDPAKMLRRLWRRTLWRWVAKILR